MQFRNNNQFGSQSMFGQGIDFKSLFSFSDISEKTQAHLTKVYGLLLVCCMICASGMWLNAANIITGFFANVFSIILSVYLMY